MTLSPKAIEAGTKAVRRHHAWSCFWSFDDAKQLVETALTAALEADGVVLVSRAVRLCSVCNKPITSLNDVQFIKRRFAGLMLVHDQCAASPPAGQEG